MSDPKKTKAMTEVKPTFRQSGGPLTKVEPTILRPTPAGGGVGGRKPSPLLLWGGLLIGLGLLGAAGALALTLFGVALKVITVAAYAVMIIALIRLWPQIALAIAQVGLKAEESLVRMNPLETLELEKQAAAREVQVASARVDEAAGALEALKRRFQESKSKFSADKIASWEERIKDREDGLRFVKDALKDMREQYNKVVLIIEEAKADVAMAEADSSLAEALGNAGKDPTENRRFDLALDQIKRITGSAQSSFDTAMRTYQEKTQTDLS